MNLFLIFILILWALILWHSWRKGFIRSVLSVLLFIVFIFGVKGLTVPVSHVLSGSENVSSWAQETCRNFVDEKMQDALSGNVPKEELTSLGVPEEAAEILASGQAAALSGVIDTSSVEEAVTQKMADLLIRFIAVIVSAVICLIGIAVISAVINSLSRDREFSGVNHFLGLLTGILKCLLITWLIFMIADLLSFTAAGSAAEEAVRSSRFLSALSQINPLKNLIGTALMTAAQAALF